MHTESRMRSGAGVRGEIYINAQISFEGLMGRFGKVRFPAGSPFMDP
jgi:hypothetical protein